MVFILIYSLLQAFEFLKANILSVVLYARFCEIPQFGAVF